MSTRWLDETEQAAWRAWLEVMRLLPNHLEDRLHERHGLTLTDYQVLVEVSESAEHRLRMTELSHRTQLSKSRLSHQIGRMEAEGFVRRVPDPEDRRGVVAELTATGKQLLEDAAPTHVEGVRSHLIDHLSTEEQAVLATAFSRVLDHLTEVGE